MKNNLNILSPIDFGAMPIAKRRLFIEEYMTENFLGQSFYCPALERKVKVTKNSIKETATHASKRVESIYMVINLPQVIEKVCFTYGRSPKSGMQTKKFKAIKTHILFSFFSPTSPLAKVTIVEKANNYYVEYCVTAQDNFGAKMVHYAFTELDSELDVIQKKHSRQS